MKSYTIEHVGIAADDTAALASWYEQALGFSEFFRTEGEQPTIFLEDGSGTAVEIFARNKAESKPGFDHRTGMHLAIAVEDFDAAVADLEHRGVIFLGEPKQVFFSGRAWFFADPEGNRLHIVHRPTTPWKRKSL
ncbi:MAG: Glyoxalase/bleomycin resistance protein/dioxygenase [Spirochaetes bacterium]|nr:MAG: Glyoxalase/bleomycin resistance protein/dioxygenase [Spirochaetota bacterium]